MVWYGRDHTIPHQSLVAIIKYSVNIRSLTTRTPRAIKQASNHHVKRSKKPDIFRRLSFLKGYKSLLVFHGTSPSPAVIGVGKLYTQTNCFYNYYYKKKTIMPPTELSSLLPTENNKEGSASTTTNGSATASMNSVSTALAIIQVVVLVFLAIGTTYSQEEYKVKE